MGPTGRRELRLAKVASLRLNVCSRHLRRDENIGLLGSYGAQNMQVLVTSSARCAVVGKR